jgi:hypothetical protein
MRAASLLIIASVAVPAYGAQCAAQSGPGTAALVELYTSKGCSTCPPADQWLATLGPRHAAGRVVPLALHVHYRDYVDSKEPYARRKLSHLQRMALVYVPRVMLQGRDFRDWAAKAFDDEVARINAQPAKARLRLEVIGKGPSGLDVQATAELVEPAGDAVLYLAAYQSGLESHQVVLEWLGPVPLRDGVSERRTLPLLPGASAEYSGVAAFVQDRRTGAVLQALLRPPC